MAGKGKRGRRSAWDTHIEPNLDKIVKWLEQGLTNEDCCVNLGFSHETWYKYQREKPEFAEAIARAKAKPDNRVVNALYQRAIGGKYETQFTDETEEEVLDKRTGEVKVLKKAVTRTTITAIPPDTLAAKFWLTNRRSAQWRDRQEVGGQFTIIYEVPEIEKDDD